MYEIGQQFKDPETGIVYTYRPDEGGPDNPFEHDGEFYSLCGVDEVPA